jgi:hypothetical protein
MSCSKFENDVALYAGGDLPAGRIARIESHLAECADCRALANELMALLSGLRDEPMEEGVRNRLGDSDGKEPLPDGRGSVNRAESTRLLPLPDGGSVNRAESTRLLPLPDGGSVNRAESTRLLPSRDRQGAVSPKRLSTLEEALVAQVHHRVLAEIRRRAGFSRRGALAPLLALAAALVLAVVLLWPRHPPKHVTVARVQPAHVAPVPPASIIPAHHRVVRRHHHRAPAAQPSGPPLLVQFVTDNPNIVIYWLVDQKPQGD